MAEAVGASLASNGQDGEPSRAVVRVLLAGETQDRPVSWQDGQLLATASEDQTARVWALVR